MLGIQAAIWNWGYLNPEANRGAMNGAIPPPVFDQHILDFGNSKQIQENSGGFYKFGYVKSCHFILQPLNDPLYSCFATISHQKSSVEHVWLKSVATQEQPGEKKV